MTVLCPIIQSSMLAVFERILDPLEEWPQFRHRRRPEFLQTLPHLHRTSGFFVARLRA